MANKIEVRDKIIEFGDYLGDGPIVPPEQADRLVREEPFAFLIAVIMDEIARAEKTWETPYHLKTRMGHLDPKKLALMRAEDFYQIFEKLPHKPRFWRKAAKRILGAAQHVSLFYDGKAERIWNDNPKGAEVQSRLDSLEGIAQEKAAMATRMLAKQLKVPIRNWDGIDVAVSRHIRRVFPRAGLSESNKPRDIIEAARQLNPSFPGALDYPCWSIGGKWCHPQNPECSHCYIGQKCPKLVQGNS